MSVYSRWALHVLTDAREPEEEPFGQASGPGPETAHNELEDYLQCSGNGFDQDVSMANDGTHCRMEAI